MSCGESAESCQCGLPLRRRPSSCAEFRGSGTTYGPACTDAVDCKVTTMLKRLSVLWSVVRGDARLLWFALRHPLAPGWLKPAVALMVLYVLSPVDLLPEAIPVLGLVDDVVLVPLAVASIVKRLPAALRADFLRRPS
jgi:uncharacterized membrane protein YkvA (DUF1232 family)